MISLASRVSMPTSFPRPLWAGARGGVRARERAEASKPRSLSGTRPLRACRRQSPPPTPRPQGAREFVYGGLLARLLRGRRLWQSESLAAGFGRRGFALCSAAREEHMGKILLTIGLAGVLACGG